MVLGAAVLPMSVTLAWAHPGDASRTRFEIQEPKSALEELAPAPLAVVAAVAGARDEPKANPPPKRARATTTATMIWTGRRASAFIAVLPYRVALAKQQEQPRRGWSYS